MCFYKTGHPLCTIKRCPIEVVFTNPDIMILHNIMSHAEIEKVIKIAEPLVRKINIKDINGCYSVKYLLHQKKFWIIIRLWETAHLPLP